MNAMKAVKMERGLSNVGMAVIALLLGMGTYPAQAQNAAQRAALARLGHAQTHTQATGAATDATEAANISLSMPRGVAFDASGDLFIADTDNNRILEVDVNGLVSTVAGSGAQGFGGDGAAASSAMLDSPNGVAVDSNGNIYIADTHNNRIREVSGGNISTIAGTGDAGFSGDGAAATTAALSYPTAVGVDSSNNVYIADTNNHRIREITGTTINTVAGNGRQTYSGDGGAATAAGLDSPNGVAVDAAFNLYIGDMHNQRVRMVTYTTGTISTLAGTGIKGFNSDGSAAAAELARPRGVAVDKSGTVYVADSDNNRIRAISGGQVTTIAGNGGEGYSGSGGASTSAELDSPRGIAVQGGTVFLSDTENQAVRLVSSGVVNTFAGAPSNTAESLVLGGANNPAITSSVYVLAVAQAPSSISLTTSNATFILGTSISLKAAVTSANGSPTGTINFYDGATLLNSTPAALNGGSASLTLAALPLGGQSLTAVYSGDTDFVTSASTAVAENVITPDFNIASSTPAQTVLPGLSVNYTITLTPLNPSFVYPVTLSASGLPSGVTASFTPSSIAAGAGTSSTVLTLSVSAQAQLEERVRSFGRFAAPTALALLMLPLAFWRRAHKTSRRLSHVGKVWLALLVFAGLSVLGGCGASGSSAHPVQRYTVTIAAANGINTHFTKVTLTVQ